MSVKNLFLALALVVSGFSQAFAGDLTGDWKFNGKSDHVFSIGLQLKQDGKSLTGTLMMPNGDVPLKGSLDGSDLVLEGKMEASPGGFPAGALKIGGTVKEDGTMAGKISMGGNHGGMEWTAERMKKRTPAH